MFSQTQKTFQHVLTQLARQWRLFSLGIAAILATNLLVQVLPKLLQYAIDDLKAGAAIGTIMLWALLRLGFMLVKGALGFGWRYGFFGMGRRIEYAVRNLFFGRLLSFSPRFFSQWLKGDLLSRAMSDLQTVRESIGFGWLALFDSSTAIFFTIPFMILVDTELALWCLAPMIFIPPVVSTLGRRIRHGSEELQSRLDQLSQAATESFSGVRVIQAYARRQQELARFRGQCEMYREKTMALVKLEAFFWPLLVFLTALSEVILFYKGGQRVAAGTLTLGQFVALFDYLAIISWPVMASGFVINLFVRGKVSIERINEVVNEVNALERAIDRPPAARRTNAPLLSFEGVAFHYSPDGPRILDNLNFELKAGEWLGIAGPTGAGKSSLLRLIARLYDPQMGHIYLDGMDLKDWNIKELRAQQGMVTQEPFLFSESIRDNISFGAPDLSLDDVKHYANAADMKNSIDGFEHGFDTMLGEKGVNLSGGQKQRMALARAMAVSPRLLLLDDSFSAVDTQTEERIVSGLRRRLPQTAVLLVSHRISTLSMCDRVIVMDHGRKIAEGSHEGLLEKEGFYANMAQREKLARLAGLGEET